MPRQLVAVDVRTPKYVTYEHGPIEPHAVRLRSEFSAAKHGTELATFRGTSATSNLRYDNDYRMFFERDEEAGPRFPAALGNMTIGTVTEVGSDVTRYKVGDRVYGHMGFQETHTVPEGRIEGVVPEGMSDEALMCWDPAQFALGAVRDANIRLGERVAVFGMGAIGIITVMMARLSGATWVAAIDPIEKRRELAGKRGADMMIDPTACDAGKALKDATDMVGPDVVIEASGSYRALQESIRCCAVGGRVVPLAYYQGDASPLRLGEEWHLNAVNVISSRACTEPNRETPRWDTKRICDVSFDLLKSGTVNVDGIIDPIVPFDAALAAYVAIDERPWESVKLGVRYS